MIFSESELNKLQKAIEGEKKKGKNIVWTNGCFDIMHPGHIETFKKAKELGDILVVGLNGKDNPYWKTKPGRPINNEFHRSVMLANLKQVDYVYIFNDETPVRPVDVLKPDIVLKGGDYYLGKGIDNSEKGIIENKELKYLLENIEKFIVNKNGILDITGIYKYILENNLEEEVRKISGFMPEGLVNVKNGGKVILVPIVEGCSTTNIVETLQPKEFINLVSFWKKYKNKFKDLKEFIEWYYEKLNLNYFGNNKKNIKFKQGYIYWIEFGQNIGSEINKKRPGIVVSNTGFSKKGNNLWVIPLTTYSESKKTYNFDVIINPDDTNKLKSISIARCGNILSIDKKRIKNFIGKINKGDLSKIQKKIKDIL